MKKTALFLSLLLTLITTASQGEGRFTPNKTYTLFASEATLNPDTTELVSDDRIEGKKGITLKTDIAAMVDEKRDAPDLTFHLQAPVDGPYVLASFAVTDEEGAALMRVAKGKYDSLFYKIQIDDQRTTKRVVYVPWDSPNQTSGIFQFNGKEQELKIWLPRGVRLGKLVLYTYRPPKVKEEIENYIPKITPPPVHPRLWVTPDLLPTIKKRLDHPENVEVWKKVQERALAPYTFTFQPDQEVSYNQKLEQAAEAKAFYSLMTGDNETGKEAIQLMRDYLSHVEFGNLLDITREMGRAIYTGAQIYDWCYQLMSTKDKNIIRENMLRLAVSMECGWPPVKQSIVNGHGNEAQINRDLLSMSIAIYDEDTVPYKYTSYVVLEDLVPMRRFEYQSSRHNQGVNYGAYRFSWDMHSAYLFYRMSGQRVFDENINQMANFWHYMRLPNGQMLKDGDVFSKALDKEFSYWKSPNTMLLSYAYGKDPLLKAEYQRQIPKAPSSDPLFLLLNDPELKPIPELDSLPLTHDFGPILGSMVARTGWNIAPDSDDVVAEIKGGGYHFVNHQHSDAGAIQLYYRGTQVGDIGIYGFYGTPYDMNFNKRSVAHSMMLIVDPNEDFGSNRVNDGGTHRLGSSPSTPDVVQRNPIYHNGTIVSSSFGPSPQKPEFSYYSVELAGAYSEKIDSYTRSFCFLNLFRKDIPAAIILLDDVNSAKATFKKYWQVNTLTVPEKTEQGLLLHSTDPDRVGKTHVNMLLPAPADRETTILSGKDATTVFGKFYENTRPERGNEDGMRTMISPKTESKQDRFLTVFQVTADNIEPLPVAFQETPDSYIVALADRVVVMTKGKALLQGSFPLALPASESPLQVALTGLAPGKWIVQDSSQKVIAQGEVAEGKNTLFFPAPSGTYQITHQK